MPHPITAALHVNVTNVGDTLDGVPGLNPGATPCRKQEGS